MIACVFLLNFFLVLSSTIVALIPGHSLRILRAVGLCFSLVPFLVFSVIFSYISFFDPFFLLRSYDWLTGWNFSYLFGADIVSFYFSYLSSFLIPISILVSWESIKFRFKEFLLLLFFMEFLLINVFFMFDLLFFYIFFEAVLIPMFIIIGVWGSRDRKIHAAYLFFFYTLIGSLVMLISLLYIYSKLGSFSLHSLTSFEFDSFAESLLWLAFFFSFSVKIPMFPFHIWLPEAHVEAPTAGSVLLAGILLKLGGYAFIRFSIPMFPSATVFFSPLIYTLSVLAIFYISMIVLTQIDLKKIVAYSSIAHMNYATIGMFAGTVEGMGGSVFLMLSHGLVSSALFSCIGFLYDRYGSRILSYYGGLVCVMPIYSFFLFFFIMANLGLPGTSGFLGEYLVILSSYSCGTFVTFVLVIGVIFSAAYNIWFLNRVCFGPLSKSLFFYGDLNEREISVLFLFLFLILFLGVYPFPVLHSLNMSVSLVVSGIFF